ncbi:hypothetical protein UlMin_031092 [Ulmus minor]
MTSASELFYNRRSRFGRTNPDLGLDSLPPDRNFHQNRRQNHHTNGSSSNHRHDLDGCDPLRRYPHLGHFYHRASHPERSGFRFDDSTSHFVSSNRIDTENLTSPRISPLTAEERLPGAVLLARARLRERLSGMPLAVNRPRNRSIFRIDNSGEGIVDDSTGSSADGSSTTELRSIIRRLQLLQEQSKKPQGLTQEALDCLHIEHFSSEEPDADEVISRASPDCCICLESFMPGDQLLRLPCEHRFHDACLEPWIRVRADCPCCRRVIAVNKRAMKAS